MRTVIFLTISVFFQGLLNCQTDSTETKKPLDISGYVEAYYAWDFNKPFDGKRPSYIYSHNRHNEITLNIGLLKVTYNNKGVRGNFGLMAGTYVEANLDHEPAALKNIFEANAGIKLSKKSEIWLDAGVFPSHIGMESAIGRDCWALTRSLAADNSPYYESGAKLTFSSGDGSWLVSGLVLNGWQRISRLQPSHPLSIGTQVQWKPNGKITLNSSSYFGREASLFGTKKWRVFHNFYGIFEITPKLSLAASFDNGEQFSDEVQVLGEPLSSQWFNGQVLARYVFSKKIAATARAEFFEDKDNIILQAYTDPCGCLSFSANLDLTLRENSMLRFEYKATESVGDWNISTGTFKKKYSGLATVVLAFWF